MTRKSILSVATALAILTASCGGNKENKETADNQQKETVANVDVHGQWYLENIVFSDSDYVRPSEKVPGVRQYIVSRTALTLSRPTATHSPALTRSKGDSITLGDGMMTEMACDNMATEDAIRRILPNIATVYIQNDSIARLDSRNPSEYIVLRKAPIEIK